MDTTLVGVVLNGLSHLRKVGDKTEFCVSLIRGLGGNLSEKSRTSFAKEVSCVRYIMQLKIPDHPIIMLSEVLHSRDTTYKNLVYVLL